MYNNPQKIVGHGIQISPHRDKTKIEEALLQVLASCKYLETYVDSYAKFHGSSVLTDSVSVEVSNIQKMLEEFKV